MSFPHTKEAPQKSLSVLILSPPPNVPGGVSNYAEMLKNHIQHTHYTSFWVGKPADHAESMIARLIRLFVVPYRVVRMVENEHIDVVHINPSLDVKALIRDGLILVALRRANFSNVLVTIHGWHSKLAKLLCNSNLLRPLVAKVLNGCALITVLAPEFEQQLIEMGVKSSCIRVTSTMFDAARLKVQPEEAPSRPNILFMSRFHSAKGMDLLLDAYIRIVKDYPDLDLVLAGDGTERMRLAKKVMFSGLSPQVKFTGYVSGQEKARLLNNCTIFALPTSYDEGMPIVLLEAMAVGKPVLTTKVGGLASIVKDKENGVVLDVANVDNVTKGLRELLGDPEACKKIGAHNAAYVAGRFAAPIVTNEIELIYQDIAIR
jgi:glycosyltransferase involved in cell wall biosynthesis